MPAQPNTPSLVSTRRERLADHERRYAYQVTADDHLEDGQPWYPFGLGTMPSLRARLQAASRVRKHPGIYEPGPSAEVIRCALALIEHGRPYTERVCHEGDAESGPYTLAYTGLRWGQLRLELTPTGDVFLVRMARGRWDLPALTRRVHDGSGLYRERSYVGVSAMIRDHLAALRSNVARNGADFALTGRR